MEFKMIKGTTKEVEVQLNNLKKTFWVQVEGMTSTDQQTTLCLHLVSLEDEAFALRKV
jgi:hypothetical protein